MNEGTQNEFTDKLLTILQEAFEAKPDSWTYFTNPSPDSGYLRTIAALSVDEAQKSSGGSSIASQIKHITFAIQTCVTQLENSEHIPDNDEWQQSWEVGPLDETAWIEMQNQLNDSFQRLRELIVRKAFADAESFASIIGVIAHVAYHLGTIKQKIRVLNNF